MAENRLLDTNVLVYAYDVSETRRRAIAKGLVDDVWNAGGGVQCSCAFPVSKSQAMRRL